MLKYECAHNVKKTNPNILLSIILLSYVMIVIDNSIVITGLPKIRDEFRFTLSGLSWVSSGYALSFGGLLLLSARAGDMFGRKRMLHIGLIIFSLSSLAIGLSPSADFLVLSRIIQGIGASILAPSTLAILQSSFPSGHQRARAISFYAAAGGLSASVGLVVGGFLADLISWRVGFLINVPIGLSLVIFSKHYIEETERQSGKLDIAGAILSSLGMTGVVYGTVSSASRGWTDMVTLSAFVVGTILLIFFIWVESRSSKPLMPLRLFASSERSGAYASRFLYIGAAMGFFFYSTQFMQGVLKYSPIEAGFAFLPSMIVNFIVALNVPKFINLFGSRNVLLLSLFSALIGTVLLSRLDSNSIYLSGLLIPTLLIGIGIGGAMGPLTTAGISNVESKDAGAASGVVNAMHQVGSALGLSILVTAAEFGGEGLSPVSLLVHQVNNAFYAASALIILSMLIACFVMYRKK